MVLASPSAGSESMDPVMSLFEEGREIYKRIKDAESPALSDMDRLATIGNGVFQKVGDDHKPDISAWFTLLSLKVAGPEAAAPTARTTALVQAKIDDTVKPVRARTVQAMRKPRQPTVEHMARMLSDSDEDDTSTAIPYSPIPPVAMLDRVAALQRYTMPGFAPKDHPCLLPLGRAFAMASNFTEMQAATILLGKHVAKRELPPSAAQTLLLIAGIYRCLPDEERSLLSQTLLTSNKSTAELEEGSEDEEVAFEAWIANQAKDESLELAATA